MQIHPTAPQYLVVAQLNSDKFMAVVPIKDSSFIEVLVPKYESHSKAAGKQVSIPANLNHCQPRQMILPQQATQTLQPRALLLAN